MFLYNKSTNSALVSRIWMEVKWLVEKFQFQSGIQMPLEFWTYLMWFCIRNRDFFLVLGAFEICITRQADTPLPFKYWTRPMYAFPLYMNSLKLCTLWMYSLFWSCFTFCAKIFYVATVWNLKSDNSEPKFVSHEKCWMTFSQEFMQSLNVFYILSCRDNIRLYMK